MFINVLKIISYQLACLPMPINLRKKVLSTGYIERRKLT